MDRRGFLAGILAAGFAPAVVGSGVLMPIKKIWTPSPIEALQWNADELEFFDEIMKGFEDAMIFSSSMTGIGIGNKHQVLAKNIDVRRIYA